jgi:hypothetical protein
VNGACSCFSAARTCDRRCDTRLPDHLDTETWKTLHAKDRCHSEEGARVISPLARIVGADRRISFGNGAACRARGFSRGAIVTDGAVRPSGRFFGRRTGRGENPQFRRGAFLSMTVFFRVCHDDDALPLQPFRTYSGLGDVGGDGAPCASGVEGGIRKRLIRLRM